MRARAIPIILLMQHFGTFPFDHGRVGGKVATDRHGPHAHHGEDLVIIHASHVGYDPVRRRFGVYQRPRTADRGFGDNCGKFARPALVSERIRSCLPKYSLRQRRGQPAVFIDNLLLNAGPRRRPVPASRSDDRQGPRRTAQNIEHVEGLSRRAGFGGVRPADVRRGGRTPIGDRAEPDMFFFRRTPIAGPEGHDLLEASLAPAMPTLVTSADPALDAARYHTQVEFDRTYRSIRAGRIIAARTSCSLPASTSTSRRRKACRFR